MSENTRIKQIRQHLGLTQEKFGRKIGIGGSAVSQIEKGLTKASDQTIHSICREFGINEQWLRAGDGEMLVPFDRASEIGQFMGIVLRDEGSTFKKRLVSALAKLDESDWIALEKLVTAIKEDPEP